MPCGRNQRRMRRLLYPLSATTRCGRRRGRPCPSRLMLPNRLEHRLVVPLASRHQERHGSAVPVGAHMDLRAEPAAAAAQGFARLAASGTGSMLGGAHDHAVEEVHRPVQLTLPSGLLLQGGQNALPDARAPPPIEAAGDGMPGTVVLREVSPWGAGGENPQDRGDDAAIGRCGTANPGLLGRKEGSQPLPLCIGEFMSAHPHSLRQFADRP
jgi:hypothetical protein